MSEATPRAELSFDGKGINGPDEYRSRIATFTTDEAARKYGPLFAAAPGLREQLEFALSRTEAVLDVPEAVAALEAEDIFGSEYGDLLRADVLAFKAAIAEATGGKA